MVVRITADRPRRWWRWRRAYVWNRSLPESWGGIPEADRRLFFSALCRRGVPALRGILFHLLKVPRWAFVEIQPELIAQLIECIKWMVPSPDCDRPIFPNFKHRGTKYHAPAPKGENVRCLEFPIADEYYLKFVEAADPTALLMLTAALYREADPDSARALARGDIRMPLHNRNEIKSRANKLRTLPLEYQMAALFYFAGLKQFINKVYGPWLFDSPDEDEEQEDEEAMKLSGKRIHKPDFGWWGTFQDVAESGVFGNVKAVHQSFLHDVCVYLVRQMIRAEEQRTAMKQKN